MPDTCTAGNPRALPTGFRPNWAPRYGTATTSIWPLSPRAGTGPPSIARTTHCCGWTAASASAWSLDGRLRSGAHGGAGEIGYLPVPGVPRPRVDRGGAGAFQQLVGGHGMRNMARRHGLRGGEPAAMVAAARAAGDEGDAFIDELAEGIAQGAAGVITVVDPGLLVLGGPVALAGGTVLLEKVVMALRRLSFVRPQVELSTVTTDGCCAARSRSRCSPCARSCSAGRHATRRPARLTRTP